MMGRVWRLLLLRRWVWGCCALLACLALDQGQKCNSTQYEHDGGRCCSKCWPGHKVRTECTGEMDTVCDPCEPHGFQGTWTKEKHCTPHGYCDENAGLVVQRAGNATQNVVCRCKDGTHCSSHECQTCRINKPCGPGEGVQQEANGANDTVCMNCSHGSFSSSSSATARCQPWSSCEAKQLDTKANGTRVSDVVCADVQTPPGERKRLHSLPVVLVSLAAVSILAGGAGLLLWCQNRRELQNCHLNQEPLGRQQPAEVGFDYEDECPALPVQETLLGGQPVAQEDGKDSHLAEQELL